MKRDDPAIVTRPEPSDPETERVVLGAILVNNQLLHQVSDKLTPDDFFLNSHRSIFRAMIQLYQDNLPIDEITVRDALAGTRPDEPITTAFLLSLSEGFPRLENVNQYVEIIREKSVFRRLIQRSQEIMDLCYEQRGDAMEILNRAENWIFNISQTYVKRNYLTLSDALAPAFEHLAQLYQEKSFITGVPTGFLRLDQLTCGLQKGDLIIVAARPSMGKTSFALNVALHVALERKQKVAVFSLEMSARQLVLRLLSSHASIDGQKIRSGFFTKDDWDNIGNAVEVLDRAKVFIDESADLTVLELQAKARRLQAEHGLDLIIVDYMQLMVADRQYENRVQEIAAISRSMKALAKELNLPVVALSQLSRATETRRGDHRPMLSDLRESGSIEQDADVVIFLFREEVYVKDNPGLLGRAEAIIAKQRNGPLGTVDLVFQKEFSRFGNPAVDFNSVN
mgnify:CR=1 FL=1